MTAASDDGYLAFKLRAQQHAIPISAHLELTYACACRCVFCCNSRHRDDPGALRFDDWLRVLDELRALGTLTLTFSGGDPLEHPRFFELARAARERAFAIRVFTSGVHVDRASADALAALRPLSVEMSLHGPTAAIHDAATRLPGSYDHVWAAVAALQERNVPLQLKTPLTSLNEEHADALADLAAVRGVPLRVDPALTPRDDGGRQPLRFEPSRHGIERLMRRLAGEGRVPTRPSRAPGAVNCGVGRTTLLIDPYGRVYPCVQWRTTALGDLRTQPLARIWRDSPERAEVARVATEANAMLQRLGGPLSRYHFCPGVALQLSGDPLRPDALFLRNALAAEAARSG
jgi:MoaA/NifB/PqqE/SkfB family radical SAM enzyme